MHETSDETTPNWYVVQVMSGHEAKIQALCEAVLLEEGEEIFIPHYERKKKIQREWQLVRERLFPGYLFFITRDIERLHDKLRNVRELTKILGTGDEFVPLKSHEIAFLESYGKKEHVVEMSVGYIEGDRVIITQGPMMDMQGKVRKIDRHKRIAILELDFFGQVTNVTVGLEILEKTV